KLLDAALVATEAQLLTAAFTEGIAYGTGRARPGQSNDPGQWFSKWGRDSFPSSHTSQTFAVAAVIEDRFGLGPGIVAYGLAGMAGRGPPDHCDAGGALRRDRRGSHQRAPQELGRLRGVPRRCL